jgi:hypothetical protein
MTKHPKYSFGSHAGPAHPWFAWRPVRLWYGRWVWLTTVSRQRVVKHDYLDGPDWAFWSYSDKEAGSC